MILNDLTLITLFSHIMQFNILILNNLRNCSDGFQEIFVKLFSCEGSGLLEYFFFSIEVAKNPWVFIYVEVCFRQISWFYMFLSWKWFQYPSLVCQVIYYPLEDLIWPTQQIISQFLGASHSYHWEANYVVCYLKKLTCQGILLQSNWDLSLSGLCDSNWASGPISGRFLSSSWKTKKQVARSYAETEYLSMATAACEFKWLKGFGSLGVPHPKAMSRNCGRLFI